MLPKYATFVTDIIRLAFPWKLIFFNRLLRKGKNSLDIVVIDWPSWFSNICRTFWESETIAITESIKSSAKAIYLQMARAVRVRASSIQFLLTFFAPSSKGDKLRQNLDRSDFLRGRGIGSTEFPWPKDAKKSRFIFFSVFRLAASRLFVSDWVDRSCVFFPHFCHFEFHGTKKFRLMTRTARRVAFPEGRGILTFENCVTFDFPIWSAKIPRKKKPEERITEGKRGMTILHGF